MIKNWRAHFLNQRFNRIRALEEVPDFSRIRYFRDTDMAQSDRLARQVKELKTGDDELTKRLVEHSLRTEKKRLVLENLYRALGDGAARAPAAMRGNVDAVDDSREARNRDGGSCREIHRRAARRGWSEGHRHREHRGRVDRDGFTLVNGQAQSSSTDAARFCPIFITSSGVYAIITRRRRFDCGSSRGIHSSAASDRSMSSTTDGPRRFSTCSNGWTPARTSE